MDVQNIKGARLDMKIFFSNNRHQNIEGWKALDMMLEYTKKYIGHYGH
jgi:hypothetical protein